MGGKDDDDESLVKKVTNQLADYVFSLVVPIAILTYAAPQKSMNYIVDSAYSKASLITDLNFTTVWNTTSDLINKTIPMLDMERQAVGHLVEQSDHYFWEFYESHWIDLLKEYWQYAAGAVAVLVIVMLLFPWRKLVDWVAGAIWRTIILFLGVLPLDSVGSLSEDETGNYEIFLVVGAVALTLLINYAAWWSVWFLLRFTFTLTTNALALAFGTVWRAAFGGRKGKQKILYDKND